MITNPKTENGPISRPGIASNCSLASDTSEIAGSVHEEGGRRWFRIEGVERMSPFLMSLASDGDHWLFLLSTGALTAGRKNPDHALFPYYTQDKLADMAPRTGSRTVLRVAGADGKTVHWEPFTTTGKRDEAIRRSLQKSELGSTIVLEESHSGLGLTVRVTWRPSARFGFVRKTEIFNHNEQAVSLRILDGLQNVLPAGLNQRFQNEFSILADAYKQNELVQPGNIGVYHLSSVPTDLALPMEALRANVVWQTGLEATARLLTDTQLNAFREGVEPVNETHTRGRRGSYLACANLEIAPGAMAEWYTCADIEQEAADIESLAACISDCSDLAAAIEEDCLHTETRLRKMLADADGLQCTNDPRRTMRHMSNTLFNLMRGGALVTGYTLPPADIQRSIAAFNREAADALVAVMGETPELTCSDPWNPDHPVAGAGKDALRLLREYLPLTFSRRHGDPSRPWNRFSIEIKEPDGSPRFYYQGNWRDIFQNWEALLQSWPEYIEAAISRFLNSSTADGYNPYRLTKDGFEWEVLEPGDDWANIGYWGDHQIIYLLRLLEISSRYHPEKLISLLDQEFGVYAEIPYRIRSYRQILEDPRTTIDYDDDWAARIEKRVADKGSDGKLMHAPDGSILYVSMMEKLLAPLLAKLSNFIPGGGIWMNTQRPEWNDANNALVGYGISVVTLGYVHRYLDFLGTEMRAALEGGSFSLSEEVANLLESQMEVFAGDSKLATSQQRYAFMEELNEPASRFREDLYASGLSGRKRKVDGDTILAYLESARRHVRECLLENRRDDHLWHSYNLLKLGDRKVDIQNLVVMLEGQVSILSSGILKPAEALKLLQSLRESPLYREDQESYILYPDKELPGFLGKNHVPEAAVEKNPLLRVLVNSGDRSIIRPRHEGGYGFNGSFHNKQDLAVALKRLKEKAPFASAPQADIEAVMELFEKTFSHHSFTGRSGTFFAYEGLGSIYWHMVSKLVLAVQEIAIDTNNDARLKEQLVEKYRELRDGLGVHKNPDHYGAIPTDAYSHTPAHAGAQQPGMTGQVKEDLIIRMAELGIRVENGCVRFGTGMLPREEILESPATLALPASIGKSVQLELPAGSMALTFCGVPVIYKDKQTENEVIVSMEDGSQQRYPDMVIAKDVSRELFKRSGRVSQIEVTLAS